jgi:phosphoglycerate dehydrogenase-like enzyme
MDEISGTHQAVGDARGGGVERPRLLVLTSEALFPHFFPAHVLAWLGEVGEWEHYAGREDDEELRSRVARADALLTTWHSPFLRLETLGRPRRVRLVAHCGGEVKARMEERVVREVTVTNAPGPMAAPVAEMALAMVLALVRRLREYDGEMKAGVVRTNEYVSRGETVRGRRVGVVGFGRIGRAFARMIEPLGAELYVADPFCSEDAAAGHKAKKVELEELLGACSVVVLAAGLTPETRHMLDARRLALMADGSYLVNVGRGGLVEMDALLAELRSGRIAAALDVTDPVEPLPPEHELRRLTNVLLTPHVAAGGIEMRHALGEVAASEVARFFRGERPENVVTPEMLATMT